MANGPFKKRLFGIAKEASYGTAAASATFVLPALEFDWDPEIDPAINESIDGSNYSSSDMANTTRRVNFSSSIKINEDQLPIFFLQNFSVSSTTVSGESSVYEHVLTFDNDADTSFTLFKQDDDRDSERLAGAKFSSINIVPEKGNYVRLELEGVAKYYTTSGATLSNTYENEFTSNHVSVRYADEGSGLAALNVLEVGGVNHDIPLTGNIDNYNLGSEDMDNLFTLPATYSLEATAHYPDNTIRDEYTNGTYKRYEFKLEDTSREVSGSVANTNPSATFDYPSARVSEWSEEGGPSDIGKQSFTLTALNKAGVADAPLKITVINATASY